jgi:voltage-gated potassium channel
MPSAPPRAIHPLVRRLLAALGIFTLLVFVGGVALFVLGRGRWAFAECVYMAVISITTVGFGELSQMHEVAGARFATAALIILGLGTIAYFQSNLTALLLEGVIGQALRRNRMKKQIALLSEHVVVAGAGSTGRHVIEELVSAETPFVVIDRSAEHLERVSEDLCEGRMLYVHGDATVDAVLAAAGVERARGLVSALTHDKDNLFVTLSARSLNASMRIVAKVTEDGAAPKMMRAGASGTVNPTQIGGRRMATELIRPKLNEFLDQLMRDRNQTLRLEEVVIPPLSPLIGATLGELRVRDDGHVMIVAVQRASGELVYNPELDTKLEADMAVIIMGEIRSVNRIQQTFRPPSP